jgi:hypothetical protein
MKFVSPSHFTDPDAAARRLVQIANASEVVQEGRVYIELVNNPFLNDGGTPDQCRAALARAVTVGLAVAARVRNLCEIHACRRRAFRLMAAKGWQRSFEDPIPLPRGRQLVTLWDAALYVTKLLKAEHEAPEWQAAMEAATSL